MLVGVLVFVCGFSVVVCAPLRISMTYFGQIEKTDGALLRWQMATGRDFIKKQKL
jgi:hypothetical protein